MGLNSTPSSDRIHIGFFGKRNAGKSSVINAVTGQNLSIVSEVKGTTTDPVYKAMELLPLGPVMMIDTPGLDDEGELGKLRMQKSFQVLNKTDIAVLVVDGRIGISEEDRSIIRRFRQKNIPYIIAFNKLDLLEHSIGDELNTENDSSCTEKVASPAGNTISISSVTGENIHELKELIAKQVPSGQSKYPIVSDLIEPCDFVVLVVSIDSSAPKGRLILPQQQTIRDILEVSGTAIVIKETELKSTLESLGKAPSLIITDSQVFASAAADTPDDIPLTSFSILFARHKGDLALAVKGAAAVDILNDGDTVLISEGCTHHRQCDDIGTKKLPKWLNQYTGKELHFEFVSGTEYPEDLTPFRLIVHCGGCMLNEREMKYRLQCAEDQNIPITNYGILIAYMQGILKRCISPFPGFPCLLD
ncbi:MAG: [FeFe] hydrogenase H-cluster maturation GTPase HydF [Eubacteriales bacterium]|nr:[FeFe] hydrogenase H-cluster maturation GTPase HydF [Eubacteriales bacterium]MDD3200284.1 [FeFe] hydrogenase H-cluster maturation GTPase HydF [Eubacteriales bacterium]MDD4121919.1 [FeFe] hydrogenase H-cluster maturation GTPase HydF [Eubacteriales bacterium]MDD4630503.1 [FeFe] hydrogenase H-cluster maturation GTPase HydF [Eubacteriales bacterium]